MCSHLAPLPRRTHTRVSRARPDVERSSRPADNTNCAKRRSTENRCITCRGLRRVYDKIPVKRSGCASKFAAIAGDKRHATALRGNMRAEGSFALRRLKTEERDDAKRDSSRGMGAGVCRRRRVRRRRQRSRGGRPGNPRTMSSRRSVRASQCLSDRNHLMREPRASCVARTNLPAGTSCGTHLVCNGSGTCGACTAGTACTPASPCHVGIISCAAGSPICVTAANSPNGASCGTDLVCNTGQCVACTPGLSCASTNNCKFGITSCTTGTTVCVDSANRPAGTACGVGRVCDGEGNCS